MKNRATSYWLLAASHPRRGGMTLIELLIAFAIFTVMIAGMVALTVGTLQGWRSSERGKDTSERAQRILRQIERDLRCAHVDDQWLDDPAMGRLRYAQMLCAPDGSGRPQVTLVRVGAQEAASSRRAGKRYNAIDAYLSLTEVHYGMDPQTAGVLLRSEQVFDRFDVKKERSLFSERARRSGAAAGLAAPVDNGVLHVEFQFWSARTQQWETTKGPTAGGPSLLWDSSRRDLPEFFMTSRLRDVTEAPDFVMPRTVRIVLVLEPLTGSERGTLLTEPLGPGDRQMTVADGREIPDPPGYVAVGSEWIAYDKKEGSVVRIGRRGGGGGKKGEAVAHGVGERVRYGQTYISDVVIPLARDPR